MKPVPPRIKILSGLPVFETRDISPPATCGLFGLFGDKAAVFAAHRTFRASAAAAEEVRKVLREVGTEASKRACQRHWFACVASWL
jgi:hypothetical protein